MKIVQPSANLVWVTPNAERTIEEAGRTCYKSEDKISEESSARFIKQILSSGHESVLEHASASFRIVTARFTTHQIVRHRLFSYSQESQRYCNYSQDKFDNGVCFVVPVALNERWDNEQNELFILWKNSCNKSEAAYKRLLDYGCKPEVARSVLPSSCKTEIVMTGNFRNWRHFLKLRMDSHAQADIRFLANQIYDQLFEVAPNVFSKETLCK
jgi:thymidylate synthase (FAD)